MQSGHSFALASGRDNDDLILRKSLYLIYVDHSPLRHVHIAELSRNAQDVFHAPAGDRDLSAVLLRAVYDLLETVDVGGKGRDDDPALPALELALKVCRDYALRERIARILDVRRIGNERQNALFAELSEAREVYHAAVYRGRVDLIVAGVNGDARAGAYRKRDGVRYGVVDMDELHLEARADLDRLARLDLDHPDPRGSPVLRELDVHERRRQRRAVHGAVKLIHDVGHGSDVVLVTVGENDALYPLLVADEIGYVGNNGVDAVHIVVREAYSAVNDDHLLAVLVDVHVLADLVQTAKSDYFQFFCQVNLTSFQLCKLSDDKKA